MLPSPSQMMEALWANCIPHHTKNERVREEKSHGFQRSLCVLYVERETNILTFEEGVNWEAYAIELAGIQTRNKSNFMPKEPGKQPFSTFIFVSKSVVIQKFEEDGLQCSHCQDCTSATRSETFSLQSINQFDAIPALGPQRSTEHREFGNKWSTLRR